MNPDPSRSLTRGGVNTLNGNITFDETDLAIPAPSFALVFARAYNSAATVTNALGRGWSHGLEWSLDYVPAGRYGDLLGEFEVLKTGDGQFWWFAAGTNGSFTLAPPQTANLALAWTNGEYRVAWPGGTVARFDTNGVIQRLEDGFGAGLTFTHEAGKLTQVTHDNGQALALTYTGDLLARVDSLATNLYVAFSYSADGLLTNATRAADGVALPERYDYEPLCGALTQKVNTAGDVFAYTVGYVTNSPAWHGQPAVVTARGMGMALNPATAARYSHSLNYTNPGGFRTRVTYDRGDTNQVHEYAYDSVNMWVDQIIGPGAPGTAVWSNTWTRFSHDAAGNVTNQAVSDGGSGQTLASIAFYDGAHNVVSNGVAYLTNAVQNWWTCAWDTNAPAGGATAGLLLSATDPAGHKTAFEYTNGLVSVVRDCTNATSGYETRFFYATNGLLVGVTNANNHGVSYECDAAGLVSRIVPALGPDTRFLRNELGQVTAVIVPGAAGERTNALTVNGLGWVTAATHPDGSTERFAYDALGNLTNLVDAAGRTNVLTWYPTGKPASISRFLQQGTSNQEVRTEFAYDRQFNTLNITDPLGRAVERYTLDMQDRPVVVSNLENQAMTINWGVGDYVRKITRFDGTVVTNLFGNDGRLSSTRYPGETNAFTWTLEGLLRTISGKMGTISNGFDTVDRLTYQRQIVGTRTNVVTWQWDPAGNVTNVAVTNTAVWFGWSFDAAERPSALVAQAATNQVSVFQWTYNTNNGLVASVTNAAISEFLGYDVLDRATSLVWRTSSGSTNRSFAYAFDAAGMITNVAREDGGWTAYSYDSLDRLTSERQYASTGLTYSASWTYDLAGNRTMAVTNGVTNLYTYASGNRATNFGPNTLIQYDLAGNTTNLQYSATRKLGLYWNGRYELTEVRTNGTTAEKYDYDALGRRVRIIACSTTNTLVYDGPHVVAEWSNNVLARSYAYGPGIDDIRALTTYGAATNTYLYLKDHLGSVHALVTTNGTVVEQYRYTAWGETTVLNSNGTALAVSAYGNRFTFQGREVSWSTGLLFFRSRHYAPTLGRWLSKDPIGMSGGLNLYIAMNDNLVNYIDSFGLCKGEVDAQGNEYGGYHPVLKANGKYDGDDYTKYYLKTWNKYQQQSVFHRVPFFNWYFWSIKGGRDLKSNGYRREVFDLGGEDLTGDQLGNYAPGKAIATSHGEWLSKTAAIIVEVAGWLDYKDTDYSRLWQDAKGSWEMNFKGARDAAH